MVMEPLLYITVKVIAITRSCAYNLWAKWITKLGASTSLHTLNAHLTVCQELYNLWPSHPFPRPHNIHYCVNFIPQMTNTMEAGLGMRLVF